MITKIKLKSFGLFSYVLSFFLKNENNMWIFGAGNGHAYVDNSRYLFEWVSTKKDKKVYWITKELKLYRAIKINKKSNIIYFYSLRGIIVLAKAKVYICSHGINDITPYANKNKVIICLWHGLPIKKIGNMAKGTFGKDNKINHFVNRLINANEKIDLFLTPSAYYKNIFEQSFGSKVKDYLFAQYPRVTELKSRYKKIGERGANSRIIVFAPTFRDYVSECYYEKSGILPSLDYLPKLNLILEKLNFKMVIKLHPYIYVNHTYMDALSEFNHIIYADKNDDVLDTLINSEMLITDYSSIYFDFLSLKKEVIFLMPDYEMYKNNGRGLNFEFEKMAPGRICKTWSHIADYLQCRESEEFIPDAKYESSLRISNEFEVRGNEYIFKEIENRLLIK